MDKKKETISLYLFFISTILIGFQLIIGINPNIEVELENGEIIKSTIPLSFPIYSTIILMVLTSISSMSLMYYLDILNKKKKMNLAHSIKLDLLNDNEKKVFQFLLKHDSISQKDLSYELNISKVKLTRILQKLEQKNILEKISYGNSNKIRLK